MWLFHAWIFCSNMLMSDCISHKNVDLFSKCPSFHNRIILDLHLTASKTIEKTGEMNKNIVWSMFTAIKKMLVLHIFHSLHVRKAICTDMVVFNTVCLIEIFEYDITTFWIVFSFTLKWTTGANSLTWRPLKCVLGEAFWLVIWTL